MKLVKKNLPFILFAVIFLILFPYTTPNKDEFRGFVFAKDDKVKMRISAILVKSKTEAQKILLKLESGADFAELARKHSIGPSKEVGGDIGYFVPGDLMEELKAVAINLKIGEYSGIIKTDNGFFVLMKTEEKSSSEIMAIEAKEKLWKELNYKAESLFQQGRYSEAAQVAEEALKVAENIFGADHPHMAESLNNLALLYDSQGKYAEAEPLYKRSLAIFEKALGPRIIRKWGDP